MKLTKRKKINIGISLLAITVIVAIVAANIIYNRTHYAVEFYNVSAGAEAERMRIVFLSDLHLREYGENNKDLLEDVKRLSPDLIVLGGDFVIDDEENYDSALTVCKSLAEISPTYGVWGNHEDVKLYVQKDKNLKQNFENTGVRFLTNETASVNVNGARVVLCGIDGTVSNFEKYGAKEVMESFSKAEGYKICIAHVPTYFTKKLAKYEFNLGLAGHAHGGVANIPKIGALYSHEEGFLPKYASGMHTLANNATLIISRGLGDSAPVPRINNVPELAVIDIN